MGADIQLHSENLFGNPRKSNNAPYMHSFTRKKLTFNCCRFNSFSA